MRQHHNAFGTDSSISSISIDTHSAAHVHGRQHVSVNVPVPAVQFCDNGIVSK